MEIVFWALVLSTMASISDLKTTDVPDWIPYLMVIIGLGYNFSLYILSGLSYPLIVSFLTGTLVLIPGYLYYMKGGWGEADAWIFASMFYMIPLYQGQIFIIPYLLNLPIIIIGYVILYSIYIGINNTFVFRKTFDKIKSKLYLFLLPIIIFFFGFSLLSFYAAVLVSFLIVFFTYIFIIQDNIFRKKVKKSDLKEGDVIEGFPMRGITKKEISRLKGKTFTLLTGMPFVPVFPITLYITYFMLL